MIYTLNPMLPSIYWNLLCWNFSCCHLVCIHVLSFICQPWPFDSGLWRIVFSSRPPLPASNLLKQVSHTWTIEDNCRAKGLLFGPLFVFTFGQDVSIPCILKECRIVQLWICWTRKESVCAQQKYLFMRTLLSRFTEIPFSRFSSLWIFGFSHLQCFSVYGGLGFLRGSLVLRVWRESNSSFFTAS